MYTVLHWCSYCVIICVYSVFFSKTYTMRRYTGLLYFELKVICEIEKNEIDK